MRTRTELQNPSAVAKNITSLVKEIRDRDKGQALEACPLSLLSPKTSRRLSKKRLIVPYLLLTYSFQKLGMMRMRTTSLRTRDPGDKPDGDSSGDRKVEQDLWERGPDWTHSCRVFTRPQMRTSYSEYLSGLRAPGGSKENHLSRYEHCALFENFC